jgi:hypothetical protein
MRLTAWDFDSLAIDIENEQLIVRCGSVSERHNLCDLSEVNIRLKKSRPKECTFACMNE